LEVLEQSIDALFRRIYSWVIRSRHSFGYPDSGRPKLVPEKKEGSPGAWTSLLKASEKGIECLNLNKKSPEFFFFILVIKLEIMSESGSEFSETGSETLG
jgi:hypothetical protein